MTKRNTTSPEQTSGHTVSERPFGKQSFLTRTLGGAAISGMFQRLKGERRREESVLGAMERDGFVRSAPHLAEQMNDETRTNIVTSGGAYKDILVSELSVPYQEIALAEKDSLTHLTQFLETAQNNQELVGVENAAIARSMSENLAFIGDKELNEASKGIAEYWKEQLQRREDMQLLVCVGGQSGRFVAGGRSQKSDGLLLDTILANFSDEELTSIANRIIVDPGDISDDYVTKAVLLDDWSISGTQLRQIHSNLEHYNDAISEYEVCLVAASNASIRHGLDVYHGNVPIKAFFKVDDPENEAGMEKALETNSAYPGYISGAHSSVDYNFDRSIAGMVSEATKQHEAGVDVPAILKTMPAATQVTRSYYKRSIHLNIERLNKANGKSYYDTATGRFIDRGR